MIFFKKKTSEVERFAKSGLTGREFKEKQDLALRKKRIEALETQVKRGREKTKLLDREKQLKKERFSRSTTGRFLQTASKVARGTSIALSKSGMFAGQTVKRAAKRSRGRVNRASKKQGLRAGLSEPSKPFGSGFDDFGKGLDNMFKEDKKR